MRNKVTHGTFASYHLETYFFTLFPSAAAVVAAQFIEQSRAICANQCNWNLQRMRPLHTDRVWKINKHCKMLTSEIFWLSHHGLSSEISRRTWLHLYFNYTISSYVRKAKFQQKFSKSCNIAHTKYLNKQNKIKYSNKQDKKS